MGAEERNPPVMDPAQLEPIDPPFEAELEGGLRIAGKLVGHDARFHALSLLLLVWRPRIAGLVGRDRSGQAELITEYGKFQPYG
ncbi:hypothetical protein MesoLjLb_74550 [Mesorhizobium sp. L-8-3]|nr:hypothetical protein MesoLjLb_74550 [Mesorhizobium sp. L-8-3]